MACPLPIGTVPKEDCAAIAADFGAMTVQGALPLAAAGQHAEPKLEAIRRGGRAGAIASRTGGSSSASATPSAPWRCPSTTPRTRR